MADLKNVIYLSNEDFATLSSTGTVTIGGETLTYDENCVYVTPDVMASHIEAGLMSPDDKIKLDGVAPGATANAGTVTSVRVQAGTGLSSSTSTAQTGTLDTTISVASGYKLPTTTEWGNLVTTNTAQTISGSKTFGVSSVWKPDGVNKAVTVNPLGAVLLSDGTNYTNTYYKIGSIYNGTAQASGTLTLPTKSGTLALLEDMMVSITWSALKALRDGGNLVPGQQYRITDYACTTTTPNTSSAGHVFDIIVVADATNKLNEVARAMLHSGDTYFSSNKLEAWQLWYCIDNDTARFAWADSTNGKGVIYRMIDEFNNDLPYDFKNILYQFRPGFAYYQWGSTYTFVRDSSLDSGSYYGWRCGSKPTA